MADVSTVALLGTGAMGGMYAALLANSDMRTISVASGERAKRLRRDGLIVNDKPLSTDVFDPHDVNEEAHALVADLVLVSVKHHQLDEALNDVAPIVGPQTVFMSVLNGLDSEQIIQQRFAQNKVMYCIALAMDAAREGNRIVYKNAGKLVFGLADNRVADDDVRRIQQAFDRTAIAWETPPDMVRAVWFKFMVNVGINQASALLGLPYGDFQQEGGPRTLMNSLVNEVLAVSVAAGVNLDEQDVQRWHQVLANQSATGKTSMLQDVLAGRATELEIFAGKVIALGRQHDVPTPTNEAVHHVFTTMGA